MTSEDRLARLEDKVDSLDRLLRGGNGSGMGLNGQVGLISTELQHTNERLDKLAKTLWVGVAAFIATVVGIGLDRVFGG